MHIGEVNASQCVGSADGIEEIRNAGIDEIDSAGAMREFSSKVSTEIDLHVDEIGIGCPADIQMTTESGELLTPYHVGLDASGKSTRCAFLGYDISAAVMIVVERLNDMNNPVLTTGQY